MALISPRDLTRRLERLSVCMPLIRSSLMEHARAANCITARGLYFFSLLIWLWASMLCKIMEGSSSLRPVIIQSNWKNRRKRVWCSIVFVWSICLNNNPTFQLKITSREVDSNVRDGKFTRAHTFSSLRQFYNFWDNPVWRHSTTLPLEGNERIRNVTKLKSDVMTLLSQ